jgi:hypothetical protein
MLTDSQIRALKHCAELLQDAKDDWWIIGSTAIALHGIDVGHIKDIDILLSLRDAHSLQRTTGFANLAITGSSKFRSRIFLNLEHDGIPLEFMAGFQANYQGHWQTIQPTSRRAIKLGKLRVFTPELPEIVEILRVFSREKDLERIKMIEQQSPDGLPLVFGESKRVSFGGRDG